MRLWRKLRYFLAARWVRLETRGAVGFTIFSNSRSMLAPSKILVFRLAAFERPFVRQQITAKFV